MTFCLDDERFALDVGVVQRVVRAVAVTPLPGAPAAVAGVIDLHGAVVPVVDARAVLGLPGRRLRASDQFIVVATGTRALALVVDAVGDIVDVAADDVVPREEVLGGLESAGGVLLTASGIVLVHDVDELLSAGDDAELAQAVEVRHGDG